MEGAEARVKPAGDGGVTLGANALSDPTAGDQHRRDETPPPRSEWNRRRATNITSGQQGHMPNNETSQPVEVKEDVPMS